MASKFKSQKHVAISSIPEKYDAFSRFTIQLDMKGRWQKTLDKVLHSCEDVKQCNIGDDGMITIKAELDPHKVLKCLAKLGKSVKIVKWQFGECSTNLVEKKKEAAPTNNNNNQDKGPIFPCYAGYNNNGYSYNYDFPYPVFGGNYGNYYNNNHLECGGHAADCNSYHIEKPDKYTSSSTEKPADKSSSNSTTKPEKPSSSVSFKKLDSHSHKGCSLM